MNFDDDESGAPASDLELSILRVAVAPEPDGSYRLLIQTTRGEITGLFHVCEGEPAAVVMLSGGSGFDGPADRIWARLGAALPGRGVSVLRLQYRNADTMTYLSPHEFDECVLDAMASLSFLKGIGARKVILLGHSWGAAVAIRAGELSPLVGGVVALASQRHGTEGVANLAPRPLLLVHGMEDQVVEATVSDGLYYQAGEPKRLVLYATAGHSLIQSKDELFDLLTEWIPQHAVVIEEN